MAKIVKCKLVWVAVNLCFVVDSLTDLSTDESDFSDSDHDYIEPPTEEKDEEDGDDHNDGNSQ